MKTILVRSLILCIMYIAYCMSLSADELWEKAVDIFERGKTVAQPRLMKYIEEDLKKDGTVKNTRETHMKMTHKAGKDAESEVVKVILNGKDVTKKELKKLKEQEDEDSVFTTEIVFTGDADIFNKTQQNSVKYTRLDGNEIINDISCAVYSFTLSVSDKDSKKVSYVGKVWIHGTEGFPVKADYFGESLPKQIKRLDGSVRYEFHNGILRYKSSVTNIDASLLIIAKRARMCIEFVY